VSSTARSGEPCCLDASACAVLLMRLIRPGSPAAAAAFRLSTFRATAIDDARIGHLLPLVARRPTQEAAPLIRRSAHVPDHTTGRTVNLRGERNCPRLTRAKLRRASTLGGRPSRSRGVPGHPVYGMILNARAGGSPDATAVAAPELPRERRWRARLSPIVCAPWPLATRGREPRRFARRIVAAR
jgi:hypothetical protein